LQPEDAGGPYLATYGDIWHTLLTSTVPHFSLLRILGLPSPLADSC